MSRSGSRRKFDPARGWFAALGLAPACLFFGFFVLVPLVQTFNLTRYRWSGISKIITPNGAENFKSLARDEVLPTVATNQILLMVLGGMLLIGLGVAMAHALQRRNPITRVVDSIMLFPQIMSIVVSATVWTFMWQAKYGLLTDIAKLMRLPIPEGGMLGGSPTSAKIAVLMAFVWNALGFYVMLFSAGIRNIDTEVIEASELDGSSGWHRFKNVTWPLLWSIKRVAVVYVIANVMGIFALVTLLTAGGPDNATQVLLTHMHQQGWAKNRMGYAATIAALGFIFSLVLGRLAMALIGKDPVRAPKAAVTG